MQCETCKKAEDIYNCDGCGKGLCKKCGNITSSEIKVLQLKNNRVMKFYCTECLKFESLNLLQKIVDEKTVVINNKDKIIELLEKDICQLKRELDELKLRKNQVNIETLDIKEEIKELKCMMIKSSGNKTQNIQQRPSYSQVLASKDVMLIQPKQMQDNETTKKVLQSKVEPKEIEVGISNIRNLKNGGVAIACNSKEEVNKLKEVVNEKLGSDYTIKIPNLRNPMIKIVGLSKSYEKETLLKYIVSQNENIEHKINTFNVIVVKKMVKKYMAIVEINPELYKEIIEERNGRINVDWDSCRVYEHFNIVKCFNCGRYGHKAAECKNNSICLKCCSESHREKECQSSEIKCINCTINNDKLQMNLSVNHSVFSPKCPALKKVQTSIAEKTKYKQ